MAPYNAIFKFVSVSVLLDMYPSGKKLAGMEGVGSTLKNIRPYCRDRKKSWRSGFNPLWHDSVVSTRNRNDNCHI